MKLVGFQYKDLKARPPKDRLQLRLVLREEIENIKANVNKVESSFYEHQTPYDFVRDFIPIVQELVDVHDITELNRISQIEEAVENAQNPLSSQRRISAGAVKILQKFQTRLVEYVPLKFQDLILRSQEVLKLCRKYLISYYDRKKDPKIEAAQQYNLFIDNWTKKASTCLEHLATCPQDFIRDGVKVTEISTEVLDLLERCQLLHAPLLGLFGDCSEQLHVALHQLSEWVEQDEMYPDFLRVDLGNFSQTTTDNMQTLQRLRQQQTTTQYQVRNLQKRQIKLHGELADSQERENELIVDLEYALQDHKSKLANIEIKEFELEEIRKGQDSMDFRQFSLQWAEKTREITDAKQSLPQLQKKIQAMEMRLNVINKKRKEYDHVCKQINILKPTIIEVKHLIFKMEIEIKNTVRSLEKAKEIYLYVTTSDAIFKIYYALPMERKRKPVATPRGNLTSRSTGHAATPRTSEKHHDGSLEDIFNLIAERLGHDWAKLYRSLRFVPSRGDRIIDADVRALEASRSGSDLVDCSRQMFSRWRRFHQRARLDDLRDALTEIKRTDILKAIDLHLNPPELQKAREPEKPVPDILPRELVGCYRDVERFDELRAAHRI